MTFIAWYTFDDCTSLETVTMLGVKTIETNAFLNCTSLKVLRMPQITSLESAFGAENLEGDLAPFHDSHFNSIYCGKVPFDCFDRYYFDIEPFASVFMPTTTDGGILYVPTGSKEAYLANSNFSWKYPIIEEYDIDDPYAFYDNAIYIADSEVIPSFTVTLPINLKNNITATGFEFTLRLPNGINATDVTLKKSSARIADRGSFQSSVQSDGSIKVTYYSTNGLALDGNEGEVATLIMTIPATMPVGEYQLVIDDVKITDNDYQLISVSDRFFTTLTVEPSTTDISALDYAIYTPNIEVVGKKQFQLPIYLKNDNQITSWQADLVLPEGFSIATDSYGDPMVTISGSRTTTSRHSVATNTLASGAIRLLYSSQNNIEITGNDGEIATITINIADDVEEGDYAITFKNILMVEQNETGHELAHTVSKVNVKHFLLGDPNNDGKINALDLVALVNYIFENGSPDNIREAADMDGNGKINAIDYVKMVNLILNQPESNAAPARDAEALAGSLYIAPFAMAAGEKGIATLYLEGATADYTCLQFDLTLPVGISITEAESLSARHALSYQAMADGSIRFLLSSSANKPILTDDGITRLTLQADNSMADGTYYLDTSNALLVTSNADAFSPEDMTCPFTVSNPAGISSISLNESAVKAYNLRGQQVQFDARQMSAGIYVIDGKKVVIE